MKKARRFNFVRYAGFQVLNEDFFPTSIIDLKNNGELLNLCHGDYIYDLEYVGTKRSISFNGSTSVTIKWNDNLYISFSGQDSESKLTISVKANDMYLRLELLTIIEGMMHNVGSVIINEYKKLKDEDVETNNKYIFRQSVRDGEIIMLINGQKRCISLDLNDCNSDMIMENVVNNFDCVFNNYYYEDLLDLFFKIFQENIDLIRNCFIENVDKYLRALEYERLTSNSNILEEQIDNLKKYVKVKKYVKQ